MLLGMNSYGTNLLHSVTVGGADSSLLTNVDRPQTSMYYSVSDRTRSASGFKENRKSQSIKEKIANETEKFFGFTPSDFGPNDVEQRIASDGEERKWQQRRFRHLKKQFKIKTVIVAVELQRRAVSGNDFSDNVELSAHVSTRKLECTISPSNTVCGRFAPIIQKRESFVHIALHFIYAIIEGEMFRSLRRYALGFFDQNTPPSTCKSTVTEFSSTSSYIFPEHEGQPFFVHNAYKSIRDRSANCNGMSSFPLPYQTCYGDENLHESNFGIINRFKMDIDEEDEKAKFCDRQNSLVLEESGQLLFSNGMNSSNYASFSLQASNDKLSRLAQEKAMNRSKAGGVSFMEDYPSASYNKTFHDEEQRLGLQKSENKENLSIRLKRPQKIANSFLPSVSEVDVFFDISCSHHPHLARQNESIIGVLDNNKAQLMDEHFFCNNNSTWRRSFKIEKYQDVQYEEEDERNNVLFNEETFKSYRKTEKWNRATRHTRRLPIYGKFKRGKIDPEVTRRLVDVSYDYRPFFTYWITTVQLIIMIVMLVRYGIGTDFSNGFGVIERSGNVMASYLSFVRIVVWEQNNIWIGPRFADLVHAGAKYSPCMRYDHSVHEQIFKERLDESRFTGCCIGPDGCFQTSECPKQFATLRKWSHLGSLADKSRNKSLKKTRVVCGQDPRFCKNPQYVYPFEWNTKDISKWPICEETMPRQLIPQKEKHMHCKITGRPCCIQMHGQCRITTKSYCDFVRGYYHLEATLCSQVSCLHDVCGMISFVNNDLPDQIYRLITPLFLHAGLIRFVLTFILQMTIMREFEIMIGWLRLSLIYFISGIGGYLASAVFVPYMPEVGPAGSQGGVLGALIINVLHNWNYLCHPQQVLFYHLAIAAILFLTGVLPYIDNWAQLFGFIFGCLLAAALIPFITFGKRRTRRKRFAIVLASLSISLFLFASLLVLFYSYPTTINYKALSLFNCPFANKVCDHQSLILRSWLPI